MGADYYTCDSCNMGYRDDSDFACNCDCGSNFCHKDCGKLENFTYEYDDPDCPTGEDYVEGSHHVDEDLPITCTICRKEVATDYILLEVLLRKCNLTREQVMEMWKAEKDE